MLAYMNDAPTRRTPIQHFGRRSRLSPKVQRNNFLLLSSPLTTEMGQVKQLPSPTLSARCRCVSRPPPGRREIGKARRERLFPLALLNGHAMARRQAADDFPGIRARMCELRRKRVPCHLSDILCGWPTFAGRTTMGDARR